jgi:hypothetical protein
VPRGPALAPRRPRARAAAAIDSGSTGAAASAAHRLRLRSDELGLDDGLRGFGGDRRNDLSLRGNRLGNDRLRCRRLGHGGFGLRVRRHRLCRLRRRIGLAASEDLRGNGSLVAATAASYASSSASMLGRQELAQQGGGGERRGRGRSSRRRTADRPRAWQGRRRPAGAPRRPARPARTQRRRRRPAGSSAAGAAARTQRLGDGSAAATSATAAIGGSSGDRRGLDDRSDNLGLRAISGVLGSGRDRLRDLGQFGFVDRLDDRLRLGGCQGVGLGRARPRRETSSCGGARTSSCGAASPSSLGGDVELLVGRLVGSGDLVLVGSEVRDRPCLDRDRRGGDRSLGEGRRQDLVAEDAASR